MNQLPNNTNDSSAISYDEALKELQDTLKELENKNFSLDKLVETTERAKQLVALCKDKLRTIQDGLKNTL